MPRNPEHDQDRDRLDEQAQDEGQGQAKVRPQEPDQQGKTGSERPAGTAEPSRQSPDRIPGQDEPVGGTESSRKEDEEIARKMSRSSDDKRSKGSGG